MASRLSKAYLLTKVLTANSHEVVVYLYEGAIGYLHRAGVALESGDRAGAGHHIERAISIVIELSGALNFQSGGPLAMRLNGIYNYLIESLTLAAGKGSPEALKSCESILVILHDAWKQACASERRQPAAVRQALQISA